MIIIIGIATVSLGLFVRIIWTIAGIMRAINQFEGEIFSSYPKVR